MRLGDDDRSQMPLEMGPYGVASSWGSGQGPASSTARAAHGTQTSWGGPQSVAQKAESSLEGERLAEQGRGLCASTARRQPEQGSHGAHVQDSAWMWGAPLAQGSSERGPQTSGTGIPLALLEMPLLGSTQTCPT